MEMMIYFEDLV